MTTLLDLVYNYIRVNDLGGSPLAVLKYANLHPPLVLQNLLLIQRHWSLDLVECCDIIESFARLEHHERVKTTEPLAPLSLQLSQQTMLLTQVLQSRFYVYASASTAAACVVLARLNTVLILIAFDGDPLLETRLASFISFVNALA